MTSDGAERADIAGHRPLGDKRQVRGTEVTENIAKNFARQPEKETALGFIERAAQLRKGSIRAMQVGKHGLEQRLAEGKPKATLSASFRRHGDERRIMSITEIASTTTTRRQDLIDRVRTATIAMRNAARAAFACVGRVGEPAVQGQPVTRRRSARL